MKARSAGEFDGEVLLAPGVDGATRVP